MSRKRKKRRLKKKPLIILVLLVLLVIGGIFGYNELMGGMKTPKAKQAKPVKVAKDYEFSLVMVGDALIHYGVYADAKKADGSYDFKPMISNLKPIISKYDIAYYNQETILGGTELGLDSYPMFNSPQEVGDAFIDCGFDMVSLATNHTMDKGETGVLKSVAYWKKHPEIVVSGQWASQKERDEIKTYEKNGITYAFISYTMWNNGLTTPAGKDYLNNEYSEEKAKADIEKVRDKVDVVMVAMHWGTEYSLGVDYSQEKEAKYLSDLGVDIIIGAHPHVVEPVEYINDGKTLVIYSLGNVISDQDGTERLTGLIMEATVKKHVDLADNVEITVENPKAQLVYTYANRHTGGYNKDFKLYTYSQLNDTLLPGYKNYYKQYKEVVSSRYKNLTWGLSGER